MRECQEIRHEYEDIKKECLQGIRDVEEILSRINAHVEELLLRISTRIQSPYKDIRDAAEALKIKMTTIKGKTIEETKVASVTFANYLEKIVRFLDEVIEIREEIKFAGLERNIQTDMVRLYINAMPIQQYIFV
jgi:hypothetical protein